MDVLQVPDEVRAEIEAGEAKRAEVGNDVCVVLAENWAALELFLKFQTQWRYSFSGITGLDYTPVLSYLQCKFRKTWDALFDELQAIERGALVAYRDLASK